MSEETPDNSFFKDLISDLVEKDPKMALQMMMTAFKLPMLTQFVEEHKEELDVKINISMTAGEALFLFGSCMHSIGSMGNNRPCQHDGQLHVHVLRNYQDVGMKLAKLVETIGYPESSAISDMAGAIASVDGAFQHATEMHSKISSGEVKYSDLDDMLGREVQ